MAVGVRLLSSIMVAGVVGGMALGHTPAGAADLRVLQTSTPVPGYGPAVDGLNGKAEFFGGSLSNLSLWAGAGAVSIPLAGQYGLQIDGMLGNLGSDGIGGVGGHLFWRNPASGLLGIYASHTHWDRAGGLGITHVGAEAAAYLGRMTIGVVAGVETGNSQSETANGIITTFDVHTRFWDKLDFSYYPVDDLKLSIGHRHFGGRNAGALGAEWGFGIGRGMMASLFAEGRVGEQDYKGIWGGLKVYFGQRDKTLIRRHREDDPDILMPETTGGASNSGNTQAVPPTNLCKTASLPVGNSVIACE
jgi:hypothetical protein